MFAHKRPLGDFKQPIAKPKRLGPEFNPWFWNPFNPTVRFAPDDFRKRLKDFDKDLEITWNPITERWQVWARSPQIEHKVCSGWRLLFVHHGAERQYLPLDERVFARIYQIDATRQNLSGKQYFERIVAEMERDRALREKKWQQDTIDAAMPSFEHSQISVSMRGKSNGSKFSTYHA